MVKLKCSNCDFSEEIEDYDLKRHEHTDCTMCDYGSMEVMEDSDNKNVKNLNPHNAFHGIVGKIK